MGLFQTQERARIKRVKAEQAVNLAMQNQWLEAVELNRQIIDTYPKDVEAHNRLGKALMELGKYDEAREAYNHTLRLDPTNTIAQKNLQRLEKLMEEAAPVEVPAAPVDPSLFIEETGRATTTSLVELAPAEVLAKMNPGDAVALSVQGTRVVAINTAGETLGQLEPKIRQRLIRLMGIGNEYAAVVTSVDKNSLRIIIRETYRDPAMGNRPSFPTAGEAFRGYVRDTLLRYDLEEEEEEEEEEFEEPLREADPRAREMLMDDEDEPPSVAAELEEET